MHARRPTLHPSCSALNAYDASTALRLSFLSALGWINASVAHTNSCGRRSYRPGPRSLVRKALQSSFSTTSSANQEHGQELSDVRSATRENKDRLGRGGTYGNYELLRDSFGDDRVTHDTAKLAGNGAAQQVAKTIRKYKFEGTDRQQPLRKTFPKKTAVDGTKHNAVTKAVPEPVSELEEALASHNRKDPDFVHSWSRMMKRIARDAEDFSKMRVRLSDTETINKRRSRLHYFGQYVSPQESPLTDAKPIPWAASREEVIGKSGKQVLELEIDRFNEYMKPTPAEKIAREAVISELNLFIATHLGPDVKIERFGSETTGLASATSDIDIRISRVQSQEAEDPKELYPLIRTLTAAMAKSTEYICVLSRYAKFPIINAIHKETGIDLQIVSSPSTAPQQQVTLQFMKELPHLRSLYILLRTAFDVRHLVNVFNGGIGSYGLFIMLVASLRRRSSNPPTTMADQLFRFLNFYTNFAPQAYGVSVSPPKLFKKHDPGEIPVKQYINAARQRGDTIRAAQWAIGQRRLYQPYLFCLQDPANPFNDLGRKTNAIKYLLKTAQGMRADLLAGMHDIDVAAPHPRPQRETESPVLRLVGRCHEVFYERRRRVEEYGMEIIASKNQMDERGSELGVPVRKVAEAEP